MDLEKILPAIIVFLTAFLLPFLLSKKKKKGDKKPKELSQSLLEIGVEFVVLDEDSEQVKFRRKPSLGFKSEGIFALKKSNIDFINVISASSQYGVNYFIEYLVKSTFGIREKPLRKTKMVIKKRSFFGGEVVDVIWKGDQYLTQKLNLDYDLKYKLMQADINTFKGGILIIPELKHGYIRIKTNYNFPSADIFYAIDTLAGHMRSGI
ncbi:MAG: hypothetical protein KAU46_13570, partial [Candidatus Aminicenantes bacterium]|nr:hypothetical protein [Candidatus Aminicenantes bacterium]